MKIIELVCTFPCVLLLGAFGVYFSFKSGFIQFKGMKKLLFESKSKESLTAFATALGGTVGIGSITGIGFALSQGGAGSIFWMWVSSFFAMGIKYAETYIAVKYKTEKNGGAMSALKEIGYGKLGVIFAVITLFTSFGGGNSAQSGAMAEAFENIGVSPYLVAVLSAVVLFFIMFGGRERIVKVNSFLVPISTVLYVLGMFFMLFKMRECILDSFVLIIKDAFGIKQMSAGATLFMFSRALRVGTVRGVFSHEAGMGSSPIAHANAKNPSPEKQGLWAVAEIYVDTFLVGTLTALCLICGETYSVSKVFLLFFGSVGGIVFSCFMCVFAFAAVLSWSYYSEACLRFLFGDSKKSFGIYKITAILVFSVGCVLPLGVSVVVSDIFNCLMAYPNLFLLFIKRKEIGYAKGEKRLLVNGYKRGVEGLGKLEKRTF